MNVNGCHYRTIWLKEPEHRAVQIINQQVLPFTFEILDLHTVEDVCRAIKDMYVRGAGLIGAAAAYGIYLAALKAGENTFVKDLAEAGELLKKPGLLPVTWHGQRTE
jgi:methylthioribose-1-phosphate isomerase